MKRIAYPSVCLLCPVLPLLRHWVFSSLQSSGFQSSVQHPLQLLHRSTSSALRIGTAAGLTVTVTLTAEQPVLPEQQKKMSSKFSSLIINFFIFFISPLMSIVKSKQIVIRCLFKTIILSESKI